MQKDKRAFIRVPIVSGTIEYYLRSGTYERGNLHNISNNGCFIQRELALTPHTPINIMIRLPSDLGVLDLEGEVVWVRWAKKKSSKEPLGFGVKFKTDAKRQRILDAFVIYMRNKQIIDVSKRIVEEFFGNQPTPPKGGV